jgi:transcriptional regulator with XRE-family HTH domain
VCIGNVLRELRTNKGFTLKEVGERCGVSGEMIRQYETGIRNPKIPTLNKLANALGVPLFELLPSVDGNITAEIKELAKVQFLDLLNHTMERILARLLELPFNELGELAEIVETLDPLEFYNFALTCRNARLNGITPEMLREVIIHHKWEIE